MELLKGYDSPEKAYLVNDYPYGFRLRCSIRYWIESDPKKGSRFCSQTNNPKKEGLVWNKPKKSTYAEFGAVMFIDNGRVGWDGLSRYDKLDRMISFKETYGDAIPEIVRPVLDEIIEGKKRYEELKAEGKTWQEAGRIAALEMATKKMGIVLEKGA